MQHIFEHLPIGSMGGRRYAPWPVHRDSKTGRKSFAKISRREATTLFHKANRWNSAHIHYRADGRPARYGGCIGSAGIRVLHSLIFDFLNYDTGRLDPSYEAISRKTGLGRSTVADALAWLKSLGIIAWDRHYSEYEQEDGGTLRKQETNAYAIRPPSMWRGYTDPRPNVPTPAPETWGASPAMDAPTLAEYLDNVPADAMHGDQRTKAALTISGDFKDPDLHRALASLAVTSGQIAATDLPESYRASISSAEPESAPPTPGERRMRARMEALSRNFHKKLRDDH